MCSTQYWQNFLPPFDLAALTVAVQPLGGCVVRAFAKKLTAMRAETLKSRELAKSAATAGWAG
ncbi:MAG: hypothetical protein DRP09_17845 [Candidatus Thorarchaeota archaeon]|nr:MAG: hypothetical protein DRP09_17845 [Candidatus Thorarchaeota archaeon]